MGRKIQKVLVANRGEIALRILRACKEMQIETVLVYSEADTNSLPVKFADNAVCIGPANPSLSYLNFSQIMAVATLLEVDAIHPGYGFLSENATFANICQDYNIVFIGPTPESLTRCANKAHVRSIAKQSDVPVLPGTESPLQDVPQAIQIAESIGYPLLLKASMGGGGRGIRKIDTKQQLAELFPVVQREAFASFGSDEIYLEKFLQHPRHIEVQIFGDGNGNVIHLGTRECSIQRKHQKIIEESPSCGLSKEKEALLVESALRLGQTLKYKNAGTCEFITDDVGNFYFLEVNTRIQVEHPVTEETTSTDIVKMQFYVAQNDALPLLQSDIKQSGWAMEFRVVAEDPKTFAPSAGWVEFVHFPAGRGVRIDSHIYSGYQVPSSYDSLLAKLIVRGKDRQEVIKIAKRALQEFTIQGIQTNIPLLLEIIDHQEFQKGNIHTSFLDQYIL
ncbi:MAG TPA: acetyl-CoA carboxylase biotin carboxylase subunit [Caldisericia bacterium]|nr:acetyl-CoA carboxylase biotin carboxylase subunit [Caldisericia bacterium]HXK52039.1 acetyl-CoA carboxylase biotin carboxylase subunit [Caldisericia bacterium]